MKSILFKKKQQHTFLVRNRGQAPSLFAARPDRAEVENGVPAKDSVQAKDNRPEEKTIAAAADEQDAVVLSSFQVPDAQDETSQRHRSTQELFKVGNTLTCYLY